MIEDLIALCKTKKNIYIQTHNYPDVDAISSAFGLQFVLGCYDITTKIIYVGNIDRISAEKLVNLYNIHIEKHNGVFEDTDNIICIDCQKGENNVTQQGGNVFACIDHHPRNLRYDYEYQHIELAGACATLIANYIRLLRIDDIPQYITTSLLYGLKMDTLQFTRNVTSFDIYMYQYLFDRTETYQLHYLETSNLTLSDLRAFGSAIQHINILEEMGISYVPFDCPDGLVASLSEFMLGIDELKIAIVFSIRKNGIKISVRSILPNIHAGVFIKQALKGIGDGGGHSMFAGGFIPKQEVKKFNNKELYEFVSQRFLTSLRELSQSDLNNGNVE